MPQKNDTKDNKVQNSVALSRKPIVDHTRRLGRKTNMLNNNNVRFEFFRIMPDTLECSLVAYTIIKATINTNKNP